MSYKTVFISTHQVKPTLSDKMAGLQQPGPAALHGLEQGLQLPPAKTGDSTGGLQPTGDQHKGKDMN